MRRISFLLVFALLVALAAPAGAEVTQEELAEARAKVNDATSELDDELQALNDALGEMYLLQDRIARIEAQMATRDREIALAALAAKEQARSMYVSAGSTQYEAAVNPDGSTSLGTRTAYLDAVVDLDVDAVNQLEFLQNDMARLQGELDTMAAEQEDLAARLEASSNQIMRQLEAVSGEYNALYAQWLKEEEARRIAAEQARLAAEAEAARKAAEESGYNSSAGTSTKGRTCPVAGLHHFVEDWLDPRYPNRLHHGLDMVAPAGTPLVAVENGRVYSLNYHYAGGTGLYLRGDSSDVYYYAHMSGYNVTEGQRVGRGQVVGWVGATGNAVIPHLHLGYQPGGGPLTNPYQLMVKLCR
jgi:murein DD-endopeptidase MepM/ murein hydrolase activator NlpD